MSNPSITADKTHWYQWDTGLTVTVSGGEMTECHFANRKQGTAYVQAVINGVARVPDELIQVAAPIKAYGYVSDGAGGQTYVDQSFDVIARNIPADYTYTKTAQKTIRDAEAARDQAVQAAKDAKASELAADDSAVEASNSAQSAGESASVAATSASNAAESATAAAKSASDAAASVGAINVIAPKNVFMAAIAEGYKAVAIGDEASASGQGGVGCGYKASASGFESIAIGESATSGGNSAVAIGLTATANDGGSIALGARSVTSKIDELSIGAPATETSAEYKREITHVSTPTADTSASNKKYTDDNDAKTLSDAKKYTDANTTNALVGSVSGKLLHVEDAWPSKPLSLTIEGAYKQDGTPSVDNPVPIEVIENPVLHVLGRNLIDVPNGTLSNKMEILACSPIPAGKTAYISIEASTNSSSTDIGSASVGLFDDKRGKEAYSTQPNNVVKGINRTQLTTNFDATKHLIFWGYKTHAPTFEMSNYQLEIGGYHDYRPYVGTSIPITLPAEHPYLAKLPDGTADTIEVDKDGNATLVAMVGKTESAATDGVNATVGTDAISSTGSIADGATVYYKLATPATYQIGKLDIPALPETISNVWIEANLTPECAMTYKRDINVAFENLVQAVVAAAAGE